MVRRILNTLCQPQVLGGSVSTHAYDTGELEAILDAPTGDMQRETGFTQHLSPELLAQIIQAGVDEKSAPNLTINRNETLV